jgi:acyl-CoA oxidase
MAYSIKFTGAWMLNILNEMSRSSEKLEQVDSFFEVAATSSGLKALCTFLAWQGIEDARKCCGGNGYLMASGIAPLAANYVWQITAEGDWIILMLQTARFLLKSLQNAMQGKPLADPVSYLAPLKDSASFDLAKCAPPRASSPQDFFNLDYLLQLFKYCSLVAVVNAGNQFQQKLGDHNGNFNEALNSCALEMVTTVRAHCFNFMMSNFVLAVSRVEDAKVKAVLSKLCALFACSSITDDSQWTGIIDSQQLQLAKAALVDLLDKLRPDAVPLVDAFDFPDKVLCSAIGGYDGNVYEALYESAVKSPLNQKDPFEGYSEVLRPYLDLEFLQRGNKIEGKSKL